MPSLRSLCLVLALLLAELVFGQDNAVYSNVVGPLQLQDEGPLVPDNFSLYHPLFNDYGFVVRGNTTDGQDFSLWMFMYRQTGAQEVIIDADVYQIAFIHGSFSDEEKLSMHDTPFVNTGQNIEDYYPVGSLKTEETSSYVGYSLANTTLSYDGTKWVARGTHAGVTVDITMTTHQPEFLHAGSFDGLHGCAAATTSTNYNCSGVAGGIIHLTATGSISYNGTTTQLDQAYGVHERIIQATTVPSRILNSLGEGAHWIHGWGKDFTFWTFSADYGSYSTGMVTIGDQIYTSAGANNPNATIAQKSSWLDPKSHQVTPTAWDVAINTDVGRLVSRVTGYGRLFYYWARTGGLIITQQLLANAESTFTFVNGTAMHESQFAFVESFRTMYVATPLPPSL